MLSQKDTKSKENIISWLRLFSIFCNKNTSKCLCIFCILFLSRMLSSLQNIFCVVVILVIGIKNLYKLCIQSRIVKTTNFYSFMSQYFLVMVRQVSQSFVSFVFAFMWLGFAWLLRNAISCKWQLHLLCAHDRWWGKENLFVWHLCHTNVYSVIYFYNFSLLLHCIDIFDPLPQLYSKTWVHGKLQRQ